MIITLSNQETDHLISEFQQINMLDSAVVRRFNDNIFDCDKKVSRYDHKYGHLGSIATPQQYQVYSPGKLWVDPAHPSMSPNFLEFGAFPSEAQKGHNIYAWSLAEWKNYDTFHKCVWYILDQAIPNA